MTTEIDGNPVRESLFEQSGTTVLYPSQTKKARVATDAGELRGSYPKIGGQDVWQPYLSRLWGRTNKETKKAAHGGWDIYAPYFPYPNEVPIHAPFAGKMQTVFNVKSPNDLGNRVWLWTGKPWKSQRLIFGHLNRFNGRSRKVEKGEVIGYAGCSGNADTQGECSTAGQFKVNTGHVHLSLRDAKGKIVDPLPALGWSLRFSDWKKGHTNTPSEWNESGDLLGSEPAPEDWRGRLNAKSFAIELIKKKSTNARALPEPFNLIDIDRKRSIEQTRDAFVVMHSRLRKEKDHKKYKFQHHGVKVFRESIKDATELVAQIESQRGKISADDPAKSLGVTTKMLFDANRLFWLMIGGRALLRVVSNPREKLKPKQKPTWTGVPPDCGLAGNGESWIIAGPNAQSALHAARFADDEGNARDWTASVTFGAGTDSHAILDTSAADTKGLPVGSRDYLKKCSELFSIIIYMHKFIHRSRIRLHEPDTAQYSLLKTVFEEVKNIAVHTKALPAAAKFSHPDTVELLKTLALTSKAATSAALNQFDAKNTKTKRIRPRVSALSFQPM